MAENTNTLSLRSVLEKDNLNGLNCPVHLEEAKKAKASRVSASGIYVIDINYQLLLIGY